MALPRLLLQLGLVATAALSVAVPGAQELAPRQSTPAANCSSLHVIAVRGLNQDGSRDWYQFLIGAVNIILGAVPGSSSIGMVYGAGDIDQIAGINNGTVELQEYVRQYVASCPGAKIGLLGYSDGATCVSNAICGTGSLPYIYVPALDPAYADNVVATVVWGDLTHAAFQAWNRGTCPSALGGITARIDNRGCAAFADGYNNYCDNYDNFCCTDFSPFVDAHHTYQNYYTNATADWVIRRYRAAAGSS